MVGDLFHIGHVNLLEKVRSLGDYLIVGVCSDALVASYKRQPIMSLDERVGVIEACRHVDKVIPSCPCPITADFMVDNEIDLVVRGDDLTPRELSLWYSVPISLGKFETCRYTQGISSSLIIERILDKDG